MTDTVVAHSDETIAPVGLLDEPQFVQGPCVMHLVDDQYDETHVDCSDPEAFTFTQVDDEGRQHVVILSTQMMAQLSPYLNRWINLKAPTMFAPPKGAPQMG